MPDAGYHQTTQPTQADEQSLKRYIPSGNG